MSNVPCLDYFTKGVCHRGIQCPYFHGSEAGKFRFASVQFSFAASVTLPASRPPPNPFPDIAQKPNAFSAPASATSVLSALPGAGTDAPAGISFETLLQIANLLKVTSNPAQQTQMLLPSLSPAVLLQLAALQATSAPAPAVAAVIPPPPPPVLVPSRGSSARQELPDNVVSFLSTLRTPDNEPIPRREVPQPPRLLHPLVRQAVTAATDSERALATAVEQGTVLHGRESMMRVRDARDVTCDSAVASVVPRTSAIDRKSVNMTSSAGPTLRKEEPAARKRTATASELPRKVSTAATDAAATVPVKLPVSVHVTGTAATKAVGPAVGVKRVKSVGDPGMRVADLADGTLMMRDTPKPLDDHNKVRNTQLLLDNMTGVYQNTSLCFRLKPRVAWFAKTTRLFMIDPLLSWAI